MGQLNIVCKKKVSNIDWWEQAIKNLSLVIIFSFPIILIFTNKKILKQNFVQCPIILPPSKVIFWGIISAGRNIIDIKIIPKKKKIVNKTSNNLSESDKTKIRKLIKKLSIKEIVDLIKDGKNIPKKVIYNYCLKIKNEK